MRNFYFLAALFLCFLVSCEKEELNSSLFAFDSQDLTGKWVVSDIGNVSDDNTSVDAISSMFPDWTENNFIIYQTANKTFISKGFLGNGNGIFELSGTTITNTGIPGAGFFDSKPVKYNVNFLTNSEMELSIGQAKIKLRKELKHD